MLFSTAAGDTFQTSISVSYKGRQGDTSAVVWMRDGVTLATSGEGYEIVETFDTAADPVATTSLMFVGNYISRSFEGHYNVVITNDNDVIPMSERTASTSFSISVTGQFTIRVEPLNNGHVWDRTYKFLYPKLAKNRTNSTPQHPT